MPVDSSPSDLRALLAFVLASTAVLYLWIALPPVGDVLAGVRLQWASMAVRPVALIGLIASLPLCLKAARTRRWSGTEWLHGLALLGSSLLGILLLGSATGASSRAPATVGPALLAGSFALAYSLSLTFVLGTLKRPLVLRLAYRRRRKSVPSLRWRTVFSCPVWFGAAMGLFAVIGRGALPEGVTALDAGSAGVFCLFVGAVQVNAALEQLRARSVGPGGGGER